MQFSIHPLAAALVAVFSTNALSATSQDGSVVAATATAPPLASPSRSDSASAVPSASALVTAQSNPIASTPSADDENSLERATVTGEAGYRSGESSIGAKTPQELRDIPQSVNVVDRQLMNAEGATSLADALRNVPGITIGGAEGGQIGNNINLRGFTARTDIYIDGFRDRGQYYRDVFDLEQIEVLQGPSSMLFGRGSTGGVINQQTKQPEAKDFTEVSASLGSDRRERATLDTNVVLSDTASFRLNAFGQDLSTTRDVMANKDFGLAPSLRLNPDDRTQVTLSALIQHNADMPDYGVESLNGEPVTSSRRTFYGLASDQTVQDVAMLNGTFEHTFNETFTVRSQVQLNRYRTNAVETAPHALATGASAADVIAPPAFGNDDPATLLVEMQSHDRTIVDTSVDDQTDLISHFSTGFVTHELITGFELGRDTYANQSYARTGAGLPSGMVGFESLASPSSADIAGVVTTEGNLAQSVADSLGVYFNDSMSLSDQWKVVLGLRHDTFNAELNNSISAPRSAIEDTGFTSRRAGLIYQPTRQQNYYLSYGTSFDPLLEQMTLTSGTQALPPTNTRSYEIGTKWDVLHDRLSWTAAAFNERQNNVYSLSNNEYVAAGNWLIKGISLGAVGRVTDRLQLSAGYMHLDPRVIDTTDGTSGSIPANVPKNTATLFATYALTPAWEVGGGPSYMSERFVADSGISASAPQGNVDRVAVPGYVRVDATVAYHQPRYDIRLNVFNLGNRFYYDALIPSDGGRAVPGIGRTGVITLNYRF